MMPSPEEWEDFRHDMALQAYTAPDADLDTIRDSLAARISDLTGSLCTCGHPAVVHFRGRHMCMHSTEAKTWACDCQEFTPR